MRYRIAITCFTLIVSLVSFSSTADAETAAAYTDAEVAEAVAFQTGPAARAAGVSAEHLFTASQLVGVRSQARQLLSDVQYRGQLAGIADDLRSGNPSLVENAAHQLALELLTSVEDVYGIEVAEEAARVDSSVGGYGWCSWAVACVAYAAVAVHNTVAVTALAAVAAGGVVALAAAVWKAKWFWSGGKSGESTIVQERFIAEVTTAFSR